jgi:large subunit ribosomal protein L15
VALLQEVTKGQNLVLVILKRLVLKEGKCRFKDSVSMTDFVANRLATKNEIVKILGRGELKAKLKVTAHKFTATAKAAIEAAGGEAVTI